MDTRYIRAVSLAIREVPGSITLTVRGSSMCPTIHPGDRVMVRPVGAESLHSGDIVVLERDDGFVMHRFLGWTAGRSGERLLLTKGDSCWSFDPPCPASNLVGKVQGVHRGGQRVPGVPEQGLRRQWQVVRHRLAAVLWRALKRFWMFFQVFLLLLAIPAIAAVTLTSFTVEQDGSRVLVQWKTASEVNSLGFNLYRRELPDGSEVRINGDIIPSEGSVVGARYQFVDSDVEIGSRYSYRLESISSGGESEFYGPVEVSLSLPTSTPSPTGMPLPTATPSTMPIPTLMPTSPPELTQTPSVTPHPPATATSLPADTPTATHTYVPTVTRAIARPTELPTTPLIEATSPTAGTEFAPTFPIRFSPTLPPTKRSFIVSTLHAPPTVTPDVGGQAGTEASGRMLLVGGILLLTGVLLLGLRER